MCPLEFAQEKPKVANKPLVNGETQLLKDGKPDSTGYLTQQGLTWLLSLYDPQLAELVGIANNQAYN